jgi:hypothetical protein
MWFLMLIKYIRMRLTGVSHVHKRIDIAFDKAVSSEELLQSGKVANGGGQGRIEGIGFNFHISCGSYKQNHEVGSDGKKTRNSPHNAFKLTPTCLIRLKRGSVQGTTVQSRSTVKDFKILEKADLCRNAFVIDHVGPVESKIRKERQATENRVEVVTLRKKEVETHIKNNK